jgi:3-hydroxybutyryl-CoA dehydratase
MKIEAGEKASYERTFTAKDVEIFAELSGDKGEHHITPDREGRIMLHGLLTATVPTKLGGDLNYIARAISYEFLRPVFAGDKVRAEAIITKVESSEGYQKLWMDFVCYNQNGKEVLRGTTNGIIRNLDL